MKSNIQTIFIPVDLAQYILTMKLYKQFQLYVYLKSQHSNGIFFSSSLDREKAKNNLHLKSIRTINNLLKKTIQLNWIGYKTQTRTYYIRSIDRLRILYNLNRRASFEFHINKMMSLKALMIAAVISNMIKAQERRLKERVRTRGRTNQRSFSFFPVADKAVSKILNVSPSTAHLYKKLVIKHRLGEIKKILIETPLSKDYIGVMKMYDPLAYKAIIKKGYIYIKGIDLMKVYMNFRRKRKLVR